MRLSILICTTAEEDRLPPFHELLKEIRRQWQPFRSYVEVLWMGDFMKMTVGEKRNKLLRSASGEYVCFIDDDDKISPQYIRMILDSMSTRPGMDCYPFRVEFKNKLLGRHDVLFSRTFARDSNKGDVWERMPNHLIPVRRDLALRVMFDNIQMGEDARYAKNLKPHLKTECMIPEVLYYYHPDESRSLTQKR